MSCYKVSPMSCYKPVNDVPGSYIFSSHETFVHKEVGRAGMCGRRRTVTQDVGLDSSRHIEYITNKLYN